MLSAYLRYKDVNIITFDWNAIAYDIMYSRVARKTHPVGLVLGNLIQSLVTQKRLGYNNVHLIGHSLGAHVASVAAKTAGGRVGRLTGGKCLCL